MTDKEAIKYLQQIYPNGGHCWLDEQRIEAMSMAIKALQEAADNYVGHAQEVDEDLSCFTKRNAFIAGAQWQKEQMITKACNYLFSHMGLFVTFINDDIVEDIESCEFIKKFRIAMEDNYETSGHK